MFLACAIGFLFEFPMIRNIPKIKLHDTKIKSHENKRKKWHGAEVKVEVEGNWETYGVCIISVLVQSCNYLFN